MIHSEADSNQNNYNYTHDIENDNSENIDDNIQQNNQNSEQEEYNNEQQYQMNQNDHSGEQTEQQYNDEISQNFQNSEINTEIEQIEKNDMNVINQNTDQMSQQNEAENLQKFQKTAQDKKQKCQKQFDYVSKKILNTISESQLIQQNQETIEEAYKQRKRQSFNILKEWDAQRDEFVQDHKNISLHILEQINQKISLSEQIFHSIQIFFEKIKAIQVINSKQLKENTPSLSTIDQKINPNVSAKDKKKNENSQIHEQNKNTLWYSDLAQSIQQVDQVLENQCEQVQQFVHFLDQKIILELTQHSKQYKSKLKIHKKQLYLKKQQIIKAEEIVKIKFLKYAKIFQQSVDQKQQTKKDLFNQELKYRQEIKQYFQSFKDYGYQIFNFWNDIEELEIQRISCIKQIFQLYIEKSMSIFGKVDTLNETLNKFQNFDPIIEGKKMFNYNNILNQQQIKLINQDKPDSQSTEISIKNFLYKFDFPDIELFNNGQHRLVLKKYVAELDIGTFGLKWQSIYLVFTIDDFLLIFEKNEKIMPSKIKMDCNHIQFQKRNKNNKQGNLCYIIEKNPGTFYNSNQKVLIRFKDYDQLLEFQIYLKRYGVDSSNIETILE